MFSLNSKMVIPNLFQGPFISGNILPLNNVKWMLKGVQHDGFLND